MPTSEDLALATTSAFQSTTTSKNDELNCKGNSPERRHNAKRDGLTVPVAMLTVDQSAKALNVCRAHVYALMAKGKIKSLKFGRSRRVPVSEIERLTAAAR